MSVKLTGAGVTVHLLTKNQSLWNYVRMFGGDAAGTLPVMIN